MQDVSAELGRARECYRRREWADACDAFEAADRIAALEVADLARLAETAHLLGRGESAARLLQRLFEAYAADGAVGPAARTAFMLWHALAAKGDFALAGGWIARGRRLAGPEHDLPEIGFLLIPEVERLFGGGELEAAFATAGRVAELAGRFGHRELVAIAAHLQGRARLRQGRLPEGMALLDEALVEVTSGTTSTSVTSWIYCSVIDACRELQELRRAREWTIALNAWCDAQPQYTGAFSAICRIHRAELHLLGGQWRHAVREAELACDQLTRGYGEMMAGGACYQLAEVYRLSGDFDAASEVYERAGRYGGPTQPGLALLWLAWGRPDAATAAIRRALAETTDSLQRARILPGYAEIMLAVGDLESARAGVKELAEIAGLFDTTAFRAQLAYARGAVELAVDNPEAALPALREAWRCWSDLDVPYEAARSRVLIGLSCRALRDESSAVLELDEARGTFARLGAGPDTARTAALLDHAENHAGGVEASGLSPRELEVLRLVAAGLSNREVATELIISERTVERHLSNIFAKLGVRTRTAAAAYAFERGMGGNTHRARDRPPQGE